MNESGPMDVKEAVDKEACLKAFTDLLSKTESTMVEPRRVRVIGHVWWDACWRYRDAEVEALRAEIAATTKFMMDYQDRAIAAEIALEELTAKAEKLAEVARGLISLAENNIADVGSVAIRAYALAPLSAALSAWSETEGKE